MEKCNKCKKEIPETEDYVDLVSWDMLDGEGSEIGEMTLCNKCYKDVIHFVTEEHSHH